MGYGTRALRDLRNKSIWSSPARGAGNVTGCELTGRDETSGHRHSWRTTARGALERIRS